MKYQHKKQHSLLHFNGTKNSSYCLKMRNSLVECGVDEKYF